MKEIKLNLSAEQSKLLQNQSSIHNMIHITWLKRFESCPSSLLESLNNYLGRLCLFEDYLNKGFILNLNEISTVQDEYGDDLETAFSDYEYNLKEIEKALAEGKMPKT